MSGNSILIIFCSICMFTDLKNRKILNIVTIPFALFGVLVNIYYTGIDGLVQSLFGIGIGFCILLVPFLLGGIGAGDVKMLMTIGALKGLYFTLGTAVHMAILGGIFSLIIMIKHKKLKKCLYKIKIFLVNIFLYNNLMFERIKEEDTARIYIPYSLAIGLGAISFLVFK